MRRSLGLLAIAACLSPAAVAVTAATPATATDPANPAGCDPTGGWTVTDGSRNCLLPFPNDYFTTYDAKSLTKRRVNFNSLQTPTNREGKPIDPTAWNLADGFSVGSQLLVDVPGMTKNADIAASKLPAEDKMGSYTKQDSGVVVIDTKTGKRWPVWAEVDQYTGEDSPGGQSTGPIQQDLLIHPSINFDAGTRYVVGLRHLVGDDGKQVAPTAAFAAYRDGTASKNDPRVSHFASLFKTLSKAGVSQQSLYLAWDFTTASTKNTTGRLLHMRNAAFHELGDRKLSDLKVAGKAPKFTVSQVTKNPSPEIARKIEGTFTVPCFISPSCAPTGKFQLSSGLYGTPQRSSDSTYKASFICIVPKVAYGKHPVSLRPSLYGHGLFGSPDEVEAGNVEDMANEHGMLECATEWYGMAETDVPNAVADLQDLSNFPTLIDRVEQGELDFLYLARVMIHKKGFCSDASFHRTKKHCVINRRRAYYDGNSQGGIYGGVVCAISIDINRCTLGVPGQDYAVLLPRSSDFVGEKPMASEAPDPNDPESAFSYSGVFDTSYSDQSQRMLIIDLIQMLWDRGDPEGYAAHMTTHPLARTPKHHVLLQMAWGDHQVANVEAETEARTIGARLVTPALLKSRYGAWRVPFWGLKKVPGSSYNGSALAVYDTGPTRVMSGQTLGTDPPPLADVPNRSGVDPHGAPRSAPCDRVQKSAFLTVGGRVTKPCGGPPYFANDWDGKAGL